MRDRGATKAARRRLVSLILPLLGTEARERDRSEIYPAWIEESVHKRAIEVLISKPDRPRSPIG